ncbi:zinc finger, CCHC-type containing protein [Tanacetum coccineum]
MRTTVVLVPTRNQSWNVGSVARLVTSKGIAVVVKRITQMLVVREKGLRTNLKTKVDAIAWWIDSGTTTHDVRCVGLRLSNQWKTIIIHETTAPYTPQQNGVAERKNRALKEMVNSKLSYSGLSEEFWGEAMLTACYLLNKTQGWQYLMRTVFSSIPRPKDIIPNLEESQKDDHSDDVLSETPEPRRGKRAKKAKSYGSDFQLYLVEGSRDQVGSQYSYCYSIEEDPRTYNEAMQSRDAAFWKEAIDDEIGSIMENNTWVLSDLPLARLVIQGFSQKKGIDDFDTYAPVSPHQLEYSRVIGCLMYAMTSTRPDIAYVVGRLNRFTSNPSRQHSKAITRVFKYIRALAAAGKEAEWLRNLIHEIPIWPKPIAPISIRCDSAPTIA